MDLLYKNYKRVILIAILNFFFIIISQVCMAYDLIFTGFLFLIITVVFIIYLLCFLVSNKKNNNSSSNYVTPFELNSIAIIAMIFSVSGIIESSPNNLDFRIVFSLLFAYAIIYTVLLIWNHYLVKKKAKKLSKSIIQKVIFWSFVVGFGRVIILIEQYGDTDALIITAFFYFPLLFFLIIRWVLLQVKGIIALKNEKKRTELQHLKSQVNPHFFFNTLNNLYGLVGTDTKKAQSLILKLSDMMRYSIYEGDKEYVTLAEEVDYLKLYIDLHTMRYHKTMDVTFDCDIEGTIKVMPLLFLILLENAFKHGIENLRTEAYIHASLTTKGNFIYFEIENNFDPLINETPGLGLKNLKRRLELGYAKAHQLVFDINKDVYKVKLTLQKI